MKTLKHKYSNEQLRELKQQARLELARTHFADYFSLSNPTYYHMQHTLYISEYLDRIANGEQLNLIVEVPPRHGKSALITETFPSYYLMKNPSDKVISTAYSDSLARKFGRLNRNKFKELAEPLFDLDLSYDNSSSGNWSTADGGTMISTGIMGSLTGEGADCFPQGTMIDTEIGKIDIKELFEMESPPPVLSYDHNKGKLVYKRIQATRRKISNEFTRVTTVSGNQVISTREHRYYTDKQEYRQAHLLRCGDGLTTSRIKEEHSLQSLQEREGWTGAVLPRVLQQSEKSKSNTRMHSMFKGVRERTLRIYESCKERAERLLLFERLFAETSLIQEHETLPGMRRKETSRQQVLQHGMFEGRPQEKQKTYRLWRMWDNLLSFIDTYSLLFEGMRGQSTLQKNDRKREQSLQRRHELHEVIQKHETANIRERQSKMRYMSSGANVNKLQRQNKDEFNYSSRGRKPAKQPTGEFGNDVSNMSYYSSQVGEDTVSAVENYSGESDYVYDIQIEETHNFFANGILVHNCMIIDDPVKNKQEAYSKTYRDRVWDEWEATLSTRLHDGASVIVVQTRWHEDDLTGRLLESKGRDWIRIRLPAVAEEDDLLGRAIGQPLAPELGYDKEWAEQKKKETGSTTWNSLFQQRPSAEEGSIFVRKWWQYYDKIPHRFDEQLISWDLTFKGDAESDFVVGQVWGRKGADFYLIDQIRDRMDFPTTLKTIKNVSNKYRRIRTILIEEKANGSAVISSLNREISGIIPINPKDSKIVRAQAVTPMIESGNVFIPSNAEFTSDFVEETANFPYGKNDDVVDAMTQALNRFMDKKAARIGNKNVW